MAKQFVLKRYCWNMGTTSYRVAKFNYKIEQMLLSLDEFWENNDEQWCDNTQEELIKHLNHSTASERKSAMNAKDARVITAGLKDIGLIDESRKVTGAGIEYLKILKKNTIEKNELLDIGSDSFVLLKQLLKMSKEVGEYKIRPFLIFIYLNIKLEYLTEEEFAYCMPLILNSSMLNKMERYILKIREGKMSFDDVIKIVILESEQYSYLKAKEYYMKKKVTEEVICQCGMNGDGYNYDKWYWKLYVVLKKIYVENHRKEKEVKSLWEVFNGKTGKTIGMWKALLFEDTRKTKKVLKNNIFDGATDEENFKEIFFDTMHLIKIKANLKEYSDVNKRYLCLSEIVQISENTIRLNTISKLFFGCIHNEIKRISFKKSKKLNSATKIEDISKIFAIRSEDMINVAKEIYSIDVKTIDEIKEHVSKEKLETFKNIVEKRFNNKKLIELFSMLKDEKRRHEVAKYVTTEANLPTIFEYLMAVAWYKISNLEGNPLDFMRLKLDGNLLPVSHATGGAADIIWEYEKKDKYSQHDLLIEVTLLKASAQKHNEGEPVTRHLGEHMLDTRKEAYCVFVAPELFRNTISYFINCKTYKYYAAEFKDVVDGMKIISLDIDDVCCILEKKVGYSELYDIFDNAYKCTVDIPEWHTICIKEKIASL